MELKIKKKALRVGDWLLGNNSAIEEMNEVRKEALFYKAIAQVQDMKAFEWVKCVVEASCARKAVP